METNSSRFLNAYNKLDIMLRNLYDVKWSVGFSDMIRRVADKNSTIKKYEDDLVAYARLRNAIVHKSVDGTIIAEPHDSVVEHLENISRIICTPPIALDLFGNREVLFVSENDTVEHVIYLINKYGFSNFPIIKGDKILGMINDKVLIRRLGEVMSKGLSADHFLKTTNVGMLISEAVMMKNYQVMDKRATLIDVINAFTVNHMLHAIILTENGTRDEKILAIITDGDLIKISDMLESY